MAVNRGSPYYYPGINHPSPPGPGGSPWAGVFQPPMERSWVEYWLRRNRSKSADIEFYRYACPEGVKYHRVKLPNCDEELLVTSTAGRTTFAPGSRVVVASHQGQRQKVIIGSPPPGQVGVTNFPLIDETIDIESIGITKVTPSILDRETTDNDVTVEGWGFNEDPLDIFSLVVYDWDTDSFVPDPLGDITNTVWVSSSEVTLTIDVFSTPLDYYFNLMVERA